MEKISREELLKKVSLSLEDMEKAFGGIPAIVRCRMEAYQKLEVCIQEAKQIENAMEQAARIADCNQESMEKKNDCYF